MSNFFFYGFLCKGSKMAVRQNPLLRHRIVTPNKKPVEHIAHLNSSSSFSFRIYEILYMYESLLKYTYFTSYSQKCNTCMFQDFINIKTVFKKTSTGHYILRVKIYQLTNLFIVSLIVSTITKLGKKLYTCTDIIKSKRIY